MTPKEIGKIVRVGTEFGIEKVKLTGGEPLVRSDIVDIVSAVVHESITDVSMTTNGTALAKKADELKEAGLDSVNVSLDNLDRNTHKNIPEVFALHRVLDGVNSALEAELSPVKLNTILLKGINENEIDNLLEYSFSKRVILQMIELEKVLPENNGIYEKYHVDMDSDLSSLSEGKANLSRGYI